MSKAGRHPKPPGEKSLRFSFTTPPGFAEAMSLRQGHIPFASFLRSDLQSYWNLIDAGLSEVLSALSPAQVSYVIDHLASGINEETTVPALASDFFSDLDNKDIQARIGSLPEVAQAALADLAIWSCRLGKEGAEMLKHLKTSKKR